MIKQFDLVVIYFIIREVYNYALNDRETTEDGDNYE